MPAAVSTDLGERVAAAGQFGISDSSAIRIGQRDQACIGQKPGRMGGHRRPILDGEAGKWLLARPVLKPDLTMRALTVELTARGVRVAVTVVR